MATDNWITDRRPTEADGDDDGDVVLRAGPCLSYGKAMHWRYVGLEAPWRHSNLWRPPADPHPKPTKPALALGQRWRRRDGVEVTVEKFDCDHAWGATHPFWADCHSYAPNGAANASGKLGHSQDLIELLTPEPSTLTPRRFKETPRRTVADFGHTIDAIDEDGVAWWMIVASDDDSESEWHQLLPLPAKEVAP